MTDRMLSQASSRLPWQFIVAVLLLGACLSGAFAAGRKSVTLVPENAKSVPVTISGKAKTYYLLQPASRLRVQVDGPGKLTVMSRLLLSGSSASTEGYAVKLFQGGALLKAHATQTDRSDATVSMPGLTPGKSRKFVYTVGDGSFTYDVTLENTTRDAAVKFLFQPAKRKGKLITLQPLSYDKVVTLLANEKLIAYYVASAERDVQLRVVGPTKIRVSTRLNYDEKMKGTQKYSVLITEAGKSVLQKALQTTKSVGVNYKEWKEVVPGKVVAFTLDVPSGEHTYRCSLGQSLAKSLSVKFSIPTKDLNNEE